MAGTAAYIAFGSNLGDRSATIASALRMLGDLSGVELMRVSTIIETKPAPGSDPPDQPNFLNGVAEVMTSQSPHDLLANCIEIERAHGRERPRPGSATGTSEAAVKWGPRTLDLDLLLYGELVVHEPGLEVPHPRLHERPFVLKPLVEIAPQLMHPVIGRTVECLLADLERH